MASRVSGRDVKCVFVNWILHNPDTHIGCPTLSNYWLSSQNATNVIGPMGIPAATRGNHMATTGLKVRAPNGVPGPLFGGVEYFLRFLEEILFP